MLSFFSPKFTPEKNLPDLTGKVIFVTGANHGIGYETVKHLARRGAKVYLGSRSEAKGLAAVASLEEELATAPKDATKSITPGRVLYHHCDLSTPAQAKEAAEKLAEKESKLDILINNAGVLADPSFADQIMNVNHFGTFQITQSLLPLLIKASQEPNADVRIIFVASNAHDLYRAKDPKIQFKTLDDFNVDYSTKDWWPTFARYCVSKLTNVLTIKALQRRVAEHNITCIAAHPGAVNTFSEKLPLRFLINPIVNLFFVSPTVGAYNSAFAAASPLVKQDKNFRGAYLVPVGKIHAGGENARKEALQEELWETTVQILSEGVLDRASE